MTVKSELAPIVGHTAGPWAWETPMGENCPWIVQAGKEAYEWEPIATLGDCLEDGPSPRSKAFQRVQANARLIAAAPELLEALEYTLAALGTPVPISKRHIARKIQAAIARARGETA